MFPVVVRVATRRARSSSQPTMALSLSCRHHLHRYDSCLENSLRCFFHSKASRGANMTTSRRPGGARQIDCPRYFATSRQKRYAEAKRRAIGSQEEKKATSKSSDSNLDGESEQHNSQLPNAQPAMPQSIYGKRPGQTPFSPSLQPKVEPSTQIPFASQSLNSSHDQFTSKRKSLVIPPIVSQHESDPPQTTAFPRDTNDINNPLHKLFLQEGIVPAPAITPLPNAPPSTVLPLPDPSGVSNANPEDILNMASMYDPSIHLPDKPNFNTAANRAKYEPGTPLTDELIAYIGVRGPITVAEFMRRVLRDGRFGYYTVKGSRGGSTKASSHHQETNGLSDDIDWDDDWDDDAAHTESNGYDDQPHSSGNQVIGSGGDFITAPEVSQIFGESLLVWFMTQYQSLGNPPKIQIVEIGPGKGTLICDILRSAIISLADFASALTSSRSMGNTEQTNVGIHLVEVTNGMRTRQKESLQNLEKEKQILEKRYSFEFINAQDEEGDNVPDKPKSHDDMSSKQYEDNLTTTQERHNIVSVQWHDLLSSVPTHDAATGKPIPTFIICQELIDALPIHSFQKIEGGVWRERLVDVAVRDDTESEEESKNVKVAVARRYEHADSQNPPSSSISSPSSTSPQANEKLPRLRFVHPPDTTPAIRTLLRVNRRGSPMGADHHQKSLDSLPTGSIVEACPEGLVLVQDIADRINISGGAALIIDYGGDGSSGGDTLRGFYKHRQVHPLSLPGEVDVTADVDFGALREAVNQRISLEESFERKKKMMKSNKKAKKHKDQIPVSEEKQETTLKIGAASERQRPEAFGPISQGQFLASMGAVQRVLHFIEDDSTTDDQATELYSALERLIGDDQMGKRYKVLAIASKKDGIFPPPAF